MTTETRRNRVAKGWSPWRMSNVFGNKVHRCSTAWRQLAICMLTATIFVFWLAASTPSLHGSAQHTAAVFDGPQCEYAEAIKPPADQTQPLRILSVEDRLGVARRHALVRVPLFFAAGECPILEDLVIMRVGATSQAEPLVWQADDIRRAPDGGISRVHLWFTTDLGAGEKRKFELLRRPHQRVAAGAPMTVETAADEVRVAVDDGAVAWGTNGELRRLTLGGASCEFDRGGALPHAVIAFPKHENSPGAMVTLDENTADRIVEWDTGPLFAKFRVRLAAPEGVKLVQEVRVPRDGSEIIVSGALFPGTRYGGSVKEFELVEGRPVAGSHEIVRVPAGIRRSLRAEHAYKVTALKTPDRTEALLAIPLVIGGRNGNWRTDDHDRLQLSGMHGLQRGGEGEKGTLFAFWTETRLVPARTGNADELWQVYHDHAQPLVAVVDEPGVTVDDLHKALSALAGEMKPVGWRQDAGRAVMFGKEEQARKIMERAAHSKEADEDYLLSGAKAARARITHNGERALRDDEKGRAYGQLDPYHITYTQSLAAALAVLENAPAGVTAVDLAMARGVRAAGGSVDAAGNPYIDCFSRTLNMQMGPVLFGLTAGAAAGDRSLVNFYRDLATAPPVLAVFGRGQRPYTGAPAKSSDQTDFLYQSICDFWLRTSELLANENLQLHPLAYGRFTDCVDVMADVYHGVGPHDKKDAPGLARENFFRGQAHTHRWLGWSAAPFIRLLEDPDEHATVGLTEAVRYARAMKGRWKNWPDLTFYVLADLLVREGLARYHRPELPAMPTNIVVRRGENSADITWGAVPGAVEYRVFRGPSEGGPYQWLNSPYLAESEPALTKTTFHDAAAPSGSSYVVLAVDSAGRASAWPQ